MIHGGGMIGSESDGCRDGLMIDNEIDMKMNIRYHKTTVLGLAFALCLSGCSLLEKFDKSPKYSVKGSASRERNAVDASDSQTPVLAPPSGKKTEKSSTVVTESGKKAVKNKKQKGGNATVSKAELASARRDAALAENAQTDTQESLKEGVNSGECGHVVKNMLPGDFSIGGDWTVYSVRGNLVTGEERPYVTFDLPAKRFYGSNGCNIVNGDIKADAKEELLLENIISTMRMCQDAPFEYLINLALSDVKSYAARQEGPVTFLDLKGTDGVTVMVLRRHNMDFLNGAWKITLLNGTPLDKEEKEATMTINIPDLKIHGTTGCNIFNGTLFIDPDKIDSMQFLNIATTRMGCPPASRETEFLLGLESVETARSLGNDTIGMYDPEGKEIFQMTKINVRPVEE